MIFNLANLTGNKVSTDIKDYSLLITAPSGFGKTPFLYELFGDRALFLSLENSTKGVAGAHSVPVDTYETLNAYVNQLQQPQVREKYDVVVIETLFLLDSLVENSITDSYGKELLGDCIKYNKAYKIVDKKYVKLIKKIQRMGYGMVYVSHPVEKVVTLADGSKITKFEPRLSDRAKSILEPEIDIKLFCHFNPQGEKCIFTSSTLYFDARCRVGDMDATIPFDANVFKEKFAEGIERRIQNKDMLVDHLENRNGVFKHDETFEELMSKIGELGKEIEEKGLIEKGNNIIFDELGLDDDGKQRTLADCNEKMCPTLRVIIHNLEDLLEKTENKGVA